MVYFIVQNRKWSRFSNITIISERSSARNGKGSWNQVLRNKRSDGYTWAVNPTAYAMTRYADDFVVMCNTKQQAESVYNKLKPYLAQRGLELEETKTKIVEVTKGFIFWVLIFGDIKLRRANSYL